MIADLAENQQRLVKLNRSIALHRLLVIFISSNSAYYVVLPCLKLLEHCLTTPGLETFQRSFEGEGGFALLARTLAPIWREDIQAAIFRMCIGPDQARSALLCPNFVAALMAAVEAVLVTAGEADGSSVRPSTASTRSETITPVRSINMTPTITSLLDLCSPPEHTCADLPIASNLESRDDTRLEQLLTELTAVYQASSPFRRAVTNKRIEAMLPVFAEFAAVSSSSSRLEVTGAQRQAAVGWLTALIEKSKLSHSIITQVGEQRRRVMISSEWNTDGTYCPAIALVRFIPDDIVTLARCNVPLLSPPRNVLLRLLLLPLRHIAVFPGLAHSAQETINGGRYASGADEIKVCCGEEGAA
jgi:hypothetical protein